MLCQSSKPPKTQLPTSNIAKIIIIGICLHFFDSGTGVGFRATILAA